MTEICTLRSDAGSAASNAQRWPRSLASRWSRNWPSSSPTAAGTSPGTTRPPRAAWFPSASSISAGSSPRSCAAGRSGAWAPRASPTSRSCTAPPPTMPPPTARRPRSPGPTIESTERRARCPGCTSITRFVPDWRLAEQDIRSPLLIVEHPKALTAATIESLVAYVRNGGSLLITGMGSRRPAAAGGVRNQPNIARPPGLSRSPSTATCEFDHWLLRVELSTAEPLIRATDSKGQAHPLLTRNTFGRGQAFYAAIPLLSQRKPHLVPDDLLQRVFDLVLPPDKRLLTSTARDVETVLRKKGDTYILHLVNTARATARPHRRTTKNVRDHRHPGDLALPHLRPPARPTRDGNPPAVRRPVQAMALRERPTGTGRAAVRDSSDGGHPFLTMPRAVAPCPQQSAGTPRAAAIRHCAKLVQPGRILEGFYRIGFLLLILLIAHLLKRQIIWHKKATCFSAPQYSSRGIPSASAFPRLKILEESFSGFSARRGGAWEQALRGR